MKVGFVSLGCPKNLVDTEVMLGLVSAAGHSLTADPREADVIVINTCAFIDRAKEESIDTILEMARYRQQGACRRLVVTGCLAERYRDELRRALPEIDAVVGTGEIPRIVEAVEAPTATPGAVPLRLFRRAPTGDLPAPAQPGRGQLLPGYLSDGDTPRVLTTPRHYAYLKIAEGCDYACSFCIIPTLRGPYRSRPAESILREARRLVDRGVRELILVSQDTTFYGIDRGERGALARLLRALDRLDGLTWIRLLYLYPTTVSDEILDAMGACDKVCKYIDLPLQHAAPSVLRRMRRPGGRASYARLVERIRARLPGGTLRTTFIVGFPGETLAEFQELCDFVRETAFDHVGVFTYSHEEGTAAYRLPDDVPPKEKRRRRAVLMRLARQLVRRRHRRLVGERAQVLIDGPVPEAPLVLQGRLPGQAPEIDPVVYLTDCDPSAFAPGTLVEVEIVGAHDYDLIARPLPASPGVPAGRAPAVATGPVPLLVEVSS